MDDFTDNEMKESQTSPRRRHFGRVFKLVRWLVVVAILVIVSFELVYAGKIYPGVTMDGVEVGGMTKDEAKKALDTRVDEFLVRSLAVSYGNTTLRIPVKDLGVKYDKAKAMDLAWNYGRQGSLINKFRQQLRTLIGRNTNFAAYSYDDAKLAPYLNQVSDDVTSNVVDASLSFSDNKAQVTPAQTGSRLDFGRVVWGVEDRLAQTQLDAFAAPVYQLEPVVETAALERSVHQADEFVRAPIGLTYGDHASEIDQSTIISWLTINHRSTKTFLQSMNLADLFPQASTVSVSLDKEAVKKYVQKLAGSVDQTTRNAGLAMVDGKLTVVQPSRNGQILDRDKAVDQIFDAAKQDTDKRLVALKMTTTRPDVREDNLDTLGIKEQLSEGVTYFPGSPSTRLTNVRAGASKFNGVLLKPGEVFSFGALLGDVGPQTGYVPELVILGDHEEKQYGGGLCQVSSTAFRAALYAGLPILERVNHAFAISYYTAPFGAPGVDATIYYPQVDFKFRNDTGSYLLMQTHMEGTTLKFDFYGTKTKSGNIRGPEFVSGTSDATQPSHTVFYRDVLDLAGAVIKTDKFDTWYKSSKDFPITQQFN